jgi:hypothetical protein
MKQIHIIYDSVLAALLAIVPTIVLAQTEVPSGLSIASVKVSQDLLHMEVIKKYLWLW